MLAAVLVALAVFQLQFGLALVEAGHPAWIEPRGDMITMMAGHHALLHDAWRFPLAVTDDLRRPALVSIVYTDSIPWLTLALKAAGLGERLNLLGLFLLLSYLLQPLAMGALLRACSVRQWVPLFAGSAIAVFMPAWIARQFGHIALGGHFLLIFALALSVASARFGLSRGRIAGFTALAALSLGVHTYHLPPIMACFGAALASELLQRRPGAVRRVALALLAMGAAGALSVWMLGYGIGQGLSGGGGALGLYSMNILAPLLPQASALAGQHWNGTWFTGTLDPNGGQSFEGFNYLGAGILLLLAAALLLRLIARRRGSPGAVAVLLRFGPLAAAMAALALWAIGPRAYFGMHLVYDLAPPEGTLAHYLGLLRAHGRFFWTVDYALLALAVACVDRLAGRRASAALCLAALSLQAVDVSQLMLGVRQVFRPEPPTTDLPFRTSPAFLGRPWRFVPTIDCALGADGMAIVRLSALAVRRHGSSDSSPTARAQQLVCPVPPVALVTAAPGDPTITVAVADPLQPDGLHRRFAERADCYKFSRGLVCGRGLENAGLPVLTVIERRTWVPAQTIRFGWGVRPPALGRGWSEMERLGVWSDGPSAILEVTPPPQASDWILVEVDAFAYAPAPTRSQHVRVKLGGRLLANWEVSSGVYRAAVPLEAGSKDPISLALEFPDAQSPAALSPSNPDTRLLGIGLHSMTVYR